MKNKRVLITGGTGFVGANLARRALRDGHEVHLLVRRGYRPWRIRQIAGDLRLHETDLSDAEGLARAVGGIRPDWVFHCAAYGAYSSQTDARRMIETNVVGTVNLVEACARAGFEALVSAGSSSEYGVKDHPPRETEALEPNSHYAVTKAAAAMLCRYAARRRGLRIVTLRLYSVYGPYEEPTRLIPTVIVQGLRGELPPLVNPEIARDFVHADDAAEAFVLAARSPGVEPGAVFNVGTGLQTKIRQVVEVARRVMGIDAAPRWGSMPDRAWDTDVWVADPALIRQALGWEPRLAFEEGFRATVDWLRGDPEMAAYYRREITGG